MRLTCDRVQLRLITPRSASQLFQLARVPTLSHTLQWEPHQSVDDSLAYIAHARSLWTRRVAFMPGIFDLENEWLVGATGISGIDRSNHRGEVGTWIGIPYQGTGVNRLAKAAIFALGFEVLGLRRLELLVRVDNERSLAATAKLPGIIDEGVQHLRLFKRGIGYDARMFAITTETYDRAAYPAVEIDGSLP